MTFFNFSSVFHKIEKTENKLQTISTEIQGFVEQYNEDYAVFAFTALASYRLTISSNKPGCAREILFNNLQIAYIIQYAMLLTL